MERDYEGVLFVGVYRRPGGQCPAARASKGGCVSGLRNRLWSVLAAGLLAALADQM